ncbi:MAG: hypothetical protein AAGK00_12005 [Pseudomonadota bacterium]
MARWASIIILLISMGCAGPEEPTGEIAERYSGDVRPVPGRTQAIVNQTLAYWAAIEGDRWHQAYRAHALEYQQVLPFGEWQPRVRGTAMATRQPVAIHWSKSTHRHQGPELYAILSWRDPGGKQGRVIWREVSSGRFLIERTDPL